MKKILFCCVLAMLGWVFSVSAQDRSGSLYYKISAEAGNVNFVQGEVTVTDKSGEEKSLSSVEKVGIGERIRASAGSRAEILLNPGSYIRLAPNSEFEFLDTSFEDLRLKLWSGKAILEVLATKEFKVTVLTPKSEIQLIKSGVYKVEISDSGNAVSSVWEGKAFVGTNEVKEGRRALIEANGRVQIEKFDRKQRDEFDLWSKQRAGQLAKINSSLETRALRDSLLAYHREWSLYESFGVWIYHPRFGYCFLPFVVGWRSPYGYFYPYDIWRIPLPPIVFQVPKVPNDNPTTGGNGSTGSGGSKTDENRTPSIIEPPFRKIQRDMGDVLTRRPGFPADMPSKPVNTVPMTPAPVETPPILVPSAGGRKGKDN